MPKCSIHLPPELDEFFVDRIESGRYENAGELVQAALRALDREERVKEAKRAEQRNAMQGVEAASIQDRDAFRELWHAQFRSSSSF